ncbi:hypothetical protein LAWI1_G005445, partial [Lachnellula willkommii]
MTLQPDSAFPTAASATVHTFQGPLIWKPSMAKATHKEAIVLDASLPATEEKTLTREVTLHGFLNAIIWHRIDVTDCFVIRSKADGRPLERWVEWEAHKAYTYQEAGGEFADLPGGDWWMSFRYQLEEFANRIKGRK